MHVIPAIDMIQDQVVRLFQGDYSKVTHYDWSPRAFAQSLADEGFTHLHVIDLEGARTGISTVLNTIRELRPLGLSIQVGGGVRTVDQAHALIDAGANRIIVSTRALQTPGFFTTLCATLGDERVALSLDVREGTVAVDGWLTDTGRSLFEILDELRSAQTVIVTDISRDGTGSSSVNAELYRSLKNRYPEIDFIAAGGVCTTDSIETLRTAGCHACVIGKAFYEDTTLRSAIVSLGLHKGAPSCLKK